MKRILSISLTFVLVMVLLAGCGGDKAPAPADPGVDAEQTYNWRLAHEENNGSMQDVYAKEFVRVLEEKSNGRIKVDIFPVGQIGDATQQAELLQNGGLEFGIVSPGNTGAMVPENQLFSLHFLFSEDMRKNSEILKTSKALNEDLTALYLDKNIKVLAYWHEGPMQWTSNREVNTPDKWKGMKMRTMPSPMIVASYEAYGANPTPLPYLEVYSGLQLKMIDGQENPISAIEEMKFCEVQDYLTLAAANLYVTTTACNPDFFNGLPEDIQQIILETVEETREAAFKAQDDLNSVALEQIKEDYDIEVVYLTDEERELFKEKSKSAYDVYKNMVGEKGAAILDKLMEEVAEIEGK